MAKAKHAGGRPPAGIRKGDKVSEYAPFTIRLPHDVKALLKATSDVRSLPGWRVLNDALLAYVGTLPADERRLINELQKRSLKRA